MNEKACEACGQNIKRVGYLTREKRWAKARFCSRPCAGVAHSGASHYAWKGDAALATRARRGGP